MICQLFIYLFIFIHCIYSFAFMAIWIDNYGCKMEFIIEHVHFERNVSLSVFVYTTVENVQKHFIQY